MLCPALDTRVLQVIEEHNFSLSKSVRAMRGFSDQAIAIVVSRLNVPSNNQAARWSVRSVACGKSDR